jgi:GNAT superfamily N-acetyltransferase
MNPEPTPVNAASSVALVELTNPADPLSLAWLDLWETAFPPNERMLVSFYIGLLAAKGRGEQGQYHPLAVASAEGQLLGMAFYKDDPGIGIACLWYLATVPAARNHGLGAWTYREILRRIRATGLRAMVFEVEIPAEARSAEAAALAERRIGFYRRQGARMLQAIEYWQDVGPHQPRTPMHVMVHPLQEMSAEEAFAMVRGLYKEDITLIGVPALV